MDGFDDQWELAFARHTPRGAMPVGRDSRRRAAAKGTARDAKKSKAIGRAKQGIRNRRNKQWRP